MKKITEHLKTLHIDKNDGDILMNITKTKLKKMITDKQYRGIVIVTISRFLFYFILVRFLGMLPIVKKKDGRYKIQGNYLKLGENSDFAYLQVSGRWDSKLTKFIKELKPKISVDVGANVGYYTMLLSNHSDKVYAFEPLKSNFDILKNNVEYNKKSNVMLHNIALGMEEDTVEICSPSIPSWASIVTNFDENTPKQKTQVKRLDDIIEYADFVKIDVEGYEEYVLKGMDKLLSGSNPIPCILLELHPGYIFSIGKNPFELIEFITKYGYDVIFPYDKSMNYSDIKKMSSLPQDLQPPRHYFRLWHFIFTKK